jgi:hypothetical protein
MALRKRNPNQRPRGKLKQQGANNPHFSMTRRIQQKLAEYETVSIYDSTINSTLNLLCDSLVSSLGEVEHSDDKVQQFLSDNIKDLSDNYQIDIYQELKQIVKSTLWAGFSVTEVLYKSFQEGYGLAGYAQYHPSSITLRTNYKGQLTEGEPTPDPNFSSGIWQRITYPFGHQVHLGETRLKMWKNLLLTHEKTFNNYYGKSIIESCYRWHVLKESLLDMFLVTQDQHGNPLTYMMIPNTSSGETEIDPKSGEERNLTVMQAMDRQLENVSSQEGNTVMIPYSDPNMKPEVKLLSSSSDVAQGYLDAIKFCDQQIVRSLRVPSTLVDPSGISNQQLAERDMEMFNRTIEGLYKNFVVPFVNKSFGFIVKTNFGVDEKPYLPLRNIMRPEDRVSMMQFIRGLTELTYLNPSNEIDRSMVRSWVGAIEREWDEQDAEFFERFLLGPLEENQEVTKEGRVKNKSPETTTSAKEKSQSTSSTPKNRESNSHTRDRSGEGKKKPKQGRPTGQATPNVRDKSKRSTI